MGCLRKRVSFLVFLFRVPLKGPMAATKREYLVSMFEFFRKQRIFDIDN